MSRSTSLISRAVLAIAVTVGFYVLSLAIVAVLLYIPYVGWKYLGILHALFLILCIPGAAVILWSILPRPDRFAPPGSILDPGRYPKLFETLSGVARAIHQEMPSEVYLLPQAEAWVAHRGGFLGLGSRRVMGIGLPLLEALSVQQLRAVLAHELGHLHGGDTRLGPWIHRTRQAIARTLQELDKHGSKLKILFALYGMMFLRITRSVSRQQELTADETAARAVGSGPLIEGLRLIRCLQPACEAYWINWVKPIVERGFRPPMLEGCRRFLDSAPVAEAIVECLTSKIPPRRTHPYDTHPPLQERIAFLEHLPEVAWPGGTSPALTLIESTEELEIQLFQWMLQVPQTDRVIPITWDNVGREVWLPDQREIARKHARALLGITPQGIPELSRDLEGLSRSLGKPVAEGVTAEERRDWAQQTLGTVLAVALDTRGWEIRFEVGEEVIFLHEGMVIRPFTVIPRLISGELTRKAWERTCEVSGILDLDLGKAVMEGSEH